MNKRQELSIGLTAVVLGALFTKGRYHLPGFGVWTLKWRPRRRIRNPVSKKLMWLPRTPEVRFHAAKKLKGLVAAQESV